MMTEVPVGAIVQSKIYIVWGLKSEMKIYDVRVRKLLQNIELAYCIFYLLIYN
jgi:hypothetical protein